MAHLSLSLLGPFQVTLDGEPVTGFESNKVRTLLAYLAVEADRPHRREVLAALLWPEWPERTARAYLRNVLSDLRNAIQDREATPPYLLISRTMIQFNLASDCSVDVQAFQALLRDERGAETADRRLEEALSLYRGGFLEGFSLRDSPVFEDWSLVTRERLERQASTTIHRLAVAYLERGECDRAREYARRRVELEPWNEEAHRQLMRTLALCGQRSAALAQYEDCQRALQEELGVEPGPETVQLYQQIRDGVLAASREEIQEPVDLPQRRDNLLIPLAPLVGRRSELAQLGELLGDPACRLITLTGPGGSGKTRLALEVAREQVGAYADGVYLIALAGVITVEAVAPTVAEAIGCSLYGGQTPRQQLLDYLCGKEMLLVVDNVEHLLGNVEPLPAEHPFAGHPRGAAGLMIDILQTAPGVKIVATSRARLAVRDECLFPIAGMDLPIDLPQTPQGALEHSAIRLFVSGARRAQPEFELTPENLAFVVQTCRLAAGMPLAILLAAAWIPILTPAEIAGRLSDEMGQGLDLLETPWRDVPARQRSLRTVFDHSWRLLTKREQLVFQALSTFRGGFSWSAAQEVAGATLADTRSLVGKSLLQRTPDGRFEIHELLRQFAVEKLCFSSAVDAAEHGEPGTGARRRECIALPGRYCVAQDAQHCAAVHDRHCAYYAEYLSQRETDVFKGYMQETMREIDNIRAAWAWAVRDRKADEILKSATSLWLLYTSMGWYQEGAAIFGKATDSLRGNVAGESTETGEIALGLALGIQSFFSRYLGGAEQATSLVQESLSLLNKHGSGRELALCKFFARFDLPENDPEHRQLLEEALEISQRTGFYLGTMLTLRNMGRSQEALEISRDAGDRRGMAFALWHLGEEACARQAYAQARQFLEESLALAQEAGIQWVIGEILLPLGDAVLAQGEYDAARARYKEALARFKRTRSEPGILRAHAGLGQTALAMNNHRAAKQHYRQALEIAVGTHFDPTLHDATLRLYAVVGMAALLARTDVERAVELAALPQHHPSSTTEIRRRAQKLLDSTRGKLSSHTFAVAEERGRSRNLESTINELLGELEQSPPA